MCEFAINEDGADKLSPPFQIFGSATECIHESGGLYPRPMQPEPPLRILMLNVLRVRIFILVDIQQMYPNIIVWLMDCVRNKSDIKSLDFVFNRCCVKLFKTNNMLSWLVEINVVLVYLVN